MMYAAAVLVLCLAQSYASSLLAKKLKINKFYTFYAALLIALIAAYAWLGPAIQTGDLLYGAIIGIAVFIVIGVTVFLYDNKKGTPIHMPKRVGLEMVNDLFIAAPLEELMFRGILLSLLLPLGLVQALVIQAAAFAVWHLKFDAKFLLTIFAIALVFGSLYIVSGSILAPILLHALLNIGEYTLRPYLKKHL